MSKEIEELKETLVLAKKNGHLNMVKAIEIQITGLENTANKPKSILARIFSKRNKENKVSLSDTGEFYEGLEGKTLVTTINKAGGRVATGIVENE